MSEKIITARHHLTCDLCGHRIHQGTQCRVIRDDFVPYLVYFEHLRCPESPAVVTNLQPSHSVTKASRIPVMA